ncbi:hypothetical protein ENTCAN_09240 [Enterobacter cancerogenus ATCC 35316]|nr:hypothetical protein ENTCAN_09240 [Enterobacter cancerogenus ATCC 35316]
MNLPRLVGLLSERYRGAQAQKEHGDGDCVSYAHLAFALFFILSRR